MRCRGLPGPGPPGASEASRFGLWPPGLPGPDPGIASGGPTFGRPKVGGKTAGETPDPLCLPNRTLPNLTPVATEIPDVLRNRSGDLRTTPDGPRDDRYFLSCETNRWFYPFNRATAEAGRATRRRSDAKERCFSGRAAANLMASDWAKAGVQPEEGWRFFGSLLCVQK